MLSHRHTTNGACAPNLFYQSISKTWVSHIIRRFLTILAKRFAVKRGRVTDGLGTQFLPLLLVNAMRFHYGRFPGSVLQGRTSRKSLHARVLPPRPLGAAAGTSKDRSNASDFGGSAAVRRAPDSRMRNSRSTPEGSAIVIPETSTTSSFPERIDFAVFQACSRFSICSPINSPRSTNRNSVGLSCWYRSIGVHPGRDSPA